MTDPYFESIRHELPPEVVEKALELFREADEKGWRASRKAARGAGAPTTYPDSVGSTKRLSAPRWGGSKAALALILCPCGDLGWRELPFWAKRSTGKGCKRCAQLNKARRKNVSIGETYHRLLVLERVGYRDRSNIIFKVRCLDCGKEFTRVGGHLVRSGCVHCSNKANRMPLAEGVLAQGTTLIPRRHEMRPDGQTQQHLWTYADCTCTATCVARWYRVYAIKRGTSTSCGASNISKSQKHLFEIVQRILPQSKFDEYPDYLDGLQADIQAVSHTGDPKFIIEYDGPWHHEPIHGEEHLAAQQARDRRKDETCKRLGLPLYRIAHFRYRDAPKKEQKKRIEWVDAWVGALASLEWLKTKI